MLIKVMDDSSENNNTFLALSCFVRRVQYMVLYISIIYLAMQEVEAS